jgi:hypothetical protein
MIFSFSSGRMPGYRRDTLFKLLIPGDCERLFRNILPTGQIRHSPGPDHPAEMFHSIRFLYLFCVHSGFAGTVNPDFGMDFASFPAKLEKDQSLLPVRTVFRIPELKDQEFGRGIPQGTDELFKQGSLLFGRILVNKVNFAADSHLIYS